MGLPCPPPSHRCLHSLVAIGSLPQVQAIKELSCGIATLTTRMARAASRRIVAS
jgi:hypothetical protein